MDPAVDALFYPKGDVSDRNHVADPDVFCGSDQRFPGSDGLVISEHPVVNIHIQKQDLRYPVIIDKSEVGL